MGSRVGLYSASDRWLLRVASPIQWCNGEAIKMQLKAGNKAVTTTFTAELIPRGTQGKGMSPHFSYNVRFRPQLGYVLGSDEI